MPSQQGVGNGVALHVRAAEDQRIGLCPARVDMCDVFPGLADAAIDLHHRLGDRPGNARQEGLGLARCQERRIRIEFIDRPGRVGHDVPPALDIDQHFGAEMLHGLKRADLDPVLHALLGVSEHPGIGAVEHADEIGAHRHQRQRQPFAHIGVRERRAHRLGTHGASALHHGAGKVCRFHRLEAAIELDQRQLPLALRAIEPDGKLGALCVPYHAFGVGDVGQGREIALEQQAATLRAFRQLLDQCLVGTGQRQQLDRQYARGRKRRRHQRAAQSLRRQRHLDARREGLTLDAHAQRQQAILGQLPIGIRAIDGLEIGSVHDSQIARQAIGGLLEHLLFRVEQR